MTDLEPNEPLSKEEREFLALSKEDLKKMTQSFSFDRKVFEARVQSGENWTKLIQAHLYFDHVLTALLIDALANPEAISASRMGFAQKVQLINAMGLLPQDLLPPIEFMNSLRNKIAHRLDFVIAEQDVRDFANCTPQSLRDAIVTLDSRTHTGPIELHELLIVLLFQVEILRQRNAYQRLDYRQAALSLRAALHDAAPLVRSIQSRKQSETQK